MPTAKFIQSSFASGELSPRLRAHVDFAKYKNGVAECLNYLPTVHGSLLSRNGTRYVEETKTSAKQSILLPFEFSTLQAYVLEFGDLYTRFYKDGGRIDSTPGTAVELSTPYLESELTAIKYAQSADTLYLVHGEHKPAKLTRTSHTDWTIEDVDFVDGPYMDQNKKTGRTLTSSFTGVQPDNVITGAVDNGGGTVRITATAHGLTTGDPVYVREVEGVTAANGAWNVTVIDANTLDLDGTVFAGTYTSGGLVTLVAGVTASGHSPFQSGHVGSLWRIKNGSGWGYFKTVRYNTATSINAFILSALPAGAQWEWREGAWSDVRGYPQAITIYEQRLVFACTRTQPQTIWASISGSYEDFAPGVEDDDPLDYTLGSNKMNVVRWLASGATLLPGTMGEEFSIDGPNDAGLTPTNVRARSQTAHGSSQIQAARVGSSTVFVQRSSKKLRQLAFSQDAAGLSSTDLTLLAHHITGTGVIAFAYQQEPETVLWCIRKDGVLLSLTLLPSQEVSGWARHITDGSFESIVVIPSTDGTSDTAWVIVKRTINGATKRYVEYLDPEIALDSALTYDGTQAIALTPAAMTGTNIEFTAASSIFTADDVGKDIVLTEEIEGISNSRATITSYTSGTQVRCTIVYAFPNTEPIEAGGWGLAVDTVGGLAHLNMKTVALVGDGAVYPSQVVSSGSVMLSGLKALKVSAGVQFTPYMKTVEPEITRGDGDTILGVKKRFAQLYVRVLETTGVWINGILEEPVRSVSVPMGSAPVPFTGDIRCSQLGFEDASVTIEQRLPLKSEILGLWGTLEYAEQ